MPELPEVETIVRGLQEPLQNLVIEKVELLSTVMLKEASSDYFISALVGSSIKGIRRRGKFIVFLLQKGKNNFMLAVHLRMTGSLIYSSPAVSHEVPYTRAIIHFHNKSCLAFTDIRKFGTFKVLTGDQKKAFFSSLGIEPLSRNFTKKAFRKLLTGKKTPLKAFLLNQKYICGIGNIYADEILFNACLHPERSLLSLKENEKLQLWKAIRDILRQGIRAGGTSTRDYRNAAGEKGNYQNNLNVYQKVGEICPRCGALIRRIKVAGRGTYYCPGCQVN